MLTKSVMAWGAIAIYVTLTIALTVRGALRTKSLSSYAVGNRDISPVWVGLSLVAQITSVATFVINPGLVYYFGLSGLMGFGVAAGSGLMFGLILFSQKFRQIGSSVQALTVPQWIGKRYDSKLLQGVFALLSMALLSFVVLIVVAITKMLVALLGLPPKSVIVFVVLFVFSYVMIGGANTHAYTNAIQAMIMLVVALLLIGSDFSMMWSDGGILAKLHKMNPNLATVTNPTSLYFRSFFEVFVCNFIVGIAIVCQPHIVSKALYLKEDKQMRTYLTVAVLAGTVFVSVMLVGLYAKVKFPGIAKPDAVVATYVIKSFSPTLQVFVTIGILCAGFSTLEGIILALSTILSTDVYLRFFAKEQATDEAAKETQARQALRFGRIGLVIVAAVSIWMSFWQYFNPTGRSVAIFAQYGVYLLFAVSFLPLFCGMFLPKVQRLWVISAVFAAIVTYASVSWLQITRYSNNPAFLATCSIAVGLVLVVIGLFSSGGAASQEAQAT